MGCCHCESCHRWSAGPVNAFALWPRDAVKITNGSEHLVKFNKTPQSTRQWCSFIVALIAVLEVISAIFGVAVSQSLDDLLPEIDLDADGDGGGVLGWLGFGHAPFLVVMIVILSSFAITGIIIQATALGLLGATLWPALAVIVALLGSLPASAWLTRKLAWLVPSVKTSGIHRDELVGRTGRISLGTATNKRTAEAEVIGPKGLRHWIRVRAERREKIEQALS